MSHGAGHRRYFLSYIPLEEATKRFFGALDAAKGLSPMAGEFVPLPQSQGRVTAAPVWAKNSSPITMRRRWTV
jgi:molybdopterin biosynthesis enzyme